MSKFNIIMLFVLGIAAFFAILIFSGFISAPGSDNVKFAKLELWGDIPQKKIEPFILSLNGKNKDSFNIVYIEKDPVKYKDELLEAIVSGRGPDMWIITQDRILEYKDKVFLIPYTSLSQRDFKDRFIEEGELFALEEGIVGMPVFVDPLVLYWNRDMFNSAGIASVPRFWDEFMGNVSLLTVRDSSDNIIKSGTALGDFKNINHAKEIISALILQTGNNIVDPQTQEVVLGKSKTTGGNPAESALRFFTEFSDPNKDYYSWNRSLNNSSLVFTDNSLAMYFGFAGEIGDIQKRNPHLNFDVAAVPQIRDGSINVTYGKLYAVVVSKFSKNRDTALAAAMRMPDDELLKKYSEMYFFMPATRSALSVSPKDSILSVFYRAGVQSSAWLDPDSERSSIIFKEMIESIISGKARLSEAVKRASSQLELIFAEINKK